MAQPRNFGFGEEEQALKQNARRFFQERLPVDVLHRRVAHDPDPMRRPECLWDEALWGQVVELGWTLLAVPERVGGLGMSAAAVAGLVEEVGRAAFPSPLIATLQATYVLAACDAEASSAASGLLRRIAEGTPVSLAITDRRGSWEASDTDVTASGSGSVTLNGTAWFVQDARKAEVFVVKARSAAGIGLYLVEATARGVTIVPDAIVDLTRDQAHVVLRDVVVSADRVAAVGGKGEAALQAAEPAMLVVVTADMVGAAEWQLQTTAEYARTRVQFDHPIGFFQAVKHPLVEMMVRIDEARTLLYSAACAIDHEPEKAEILARMAKAAASDAASYCSGRSVQLHGGTGFTWECFVHLYFKRQKHNEVLLGDGAYQRMKLADKLIGPIGIGGGASW
ncbi:acyl-CoA dehydrogenase family protein [Chondromyces apiculatus]|uniref:Acyl-CoA dehydrogenase, short-chain specific n=1 Tax=Chondromyces apiculatus DSM 436 TaxID=1192034 RepID=A0A017TFA6_9BACT|nr:acyl-CoA dehydrogenase family protein [Chondromyces apiculatus]EYF07500.1 Acyl-CoA dehydrogenase, short-chain specific [Chondromyces apiculatus DSM 436]